GRTGIRRPPTAEARVRPPPGALDDRRAHDVAAACRLAMADVWVRLPLGALGGVRVGSESERIRQALLSFLSFSLPTLAPKWRGTQTGPSARLKPGRLWVRLRPV